MDERQVKAAVLTRLRTAYGRRRKPIVTAEFSLGSSGVRADLVAFNDKTVGFEIKTSRDTLRRLPSQMDAYSRYFDHVVVVAATSHLPSLTAADLRGATVWTYDESGTLSILRIGVTNTVLTTELEDVLTQAEKRRCDFRGAMKARYGATSDLFWRTVSRRSIRTDDLSLLSRFVENRARARRLLEERDTRWSRWLAAQDCLEGV